MQQERSSVARPRKFSEPLHPVTALVPESLLELFGEQVHRTRIKQQDAIRAAIANWTAQQEAMQPALSIQPTDTQPTSKQKAPV